MLKYILDLAKLNSLPGPHPSNYTDYSDTVPTPADEELVNSGFYFPNNPIVRLVQKTQISGTKEAACNKTYQSAGQLGPGIILFWCALHRICIGFVLLESAESCEYVYSTLVTRFQRMPAVIIYDNACNLSEYCLNRAPSLFAGTKFLVDAFHMSGHINCAHSFNSGLHKSLRGISSVVHEQKNALLAKSKIPVSLAFKPRFYT